MNVSPWALLPAELSERIYIYVLTEPSGLVYRRGADDINRICTREQQPATVSTLGGYLLALSHYIYNSLYPGFHKIARPAEQPGFNQIQYVSRQWYSEAHGLEFHYNNILFEDSLVMSAGQRCRSFVNKVAKKHYAPYLDLSIRSSGFSLQPSGNSSRPMTLVQFCRKHPKASLRLHHPFWSQKSPGFLILGLAYAAAVRGDSRLEQVVRDLGPSLDFDLMAINSTLPKEGVPLNFRLAPLEASLDRQALYEWLTAYPLFRYEDNPMWLDLAGSWFVQGL